MTSSLCVIMALCVWAEFLFYKYSKNKTKNHSWQQTNSKQIKANMSLVNLTGHNFMRIILETSAKGSWNFLKFHPKFAKTCNSYYIYHFPYFFFLFGNHQNVKIKNGQVWWSFILEVNQRLYLLHRCWTAPRPKFRYRISSRSVKTKENEKR